MTSTEHRHDEASLEFVETDFMLLLLYWKITHLCFKATNSVALCYRSNQKLTKYVRSILF